MARRLAFDPASCTECRTCELICSFAGTGVFNQRKAGIRILPQWPDAPRARFCVQCERPPCVEVCPTGALARDGEGTVLLDASLCTACGTCLPACPYEAIFLPDGAERIFKCDTCRGEFQCVSRCTVGALTVAEDAGGE